MDVLHSHHGSLPPGVGNTSRRYIAIAIPTTPSRGMPLMVIILHSRRTRGRQILFRRWKHGSSSRSLSELGRDRGLSLWLTLIVRHWQNCVLRGSQRLCEGVNLAQSLTIA